MTHRKIVEDLGAFIHEIRTEQNLSISELAQLSGVDYDNLRKYDAGLISVGPAPANKILKPFGIVVHKNYQVIIPDRIKVAR